MTMTTADMPAPSAAQKALRFLGEAFNDLGRHAARSPGEPLGRVADEGINLATNILDGLIKLRAGVADQVALARNLGRPLGEVASPEVVAFAKFGEVLGEVLAAIVERAGGVEVVAEMVVEAERVAGRRTLGPEVGQLVRDLRPIDAKLKVFDELTPPGLLPPGERIHRAGRYETMLRARRAELADRLRDMVESHADVVADLNMMLSPGGADAVRWRDVLVLALQVPPAWPDGFATEWGEAPMVAAVKAGLTHMRPALFPKWSATRPKVSQIPIRHYDVERETLHRSGM